MTQSRKPIKSKKDDPPKKVEDDDEGQEPKSVEKEQEAAKELVGDEDLSTDSDISSFKPKVPKFGGITRVGLDAWAVWTGGKPTVTWLELEDPSPKLISPNQYRPTTITGQAKSQAYRIQGLDAKFTRKSDIHTFQQDVMDHLEDHGMDTISYIVDPTDKTKMVSIVTNHGKYTLGEGTIQGDEDAAVYFDNHDKNNVRDAKRFVYNSCNEELRQQLNENCTRDCSFVTYWLELIHATQSVSMERFASVTERIKNRKVSQYPGENIERMCSDYLRDWKELDTAAMFDNNLIMNMINNMMEAGGPNNEEFRFPLRILKMDIEKTLLANRHLDYHSAKEALVKVKSDVKSVLKTVKDQYRGQLDNGRWPAAMDAKDLKGMR